MNRLCITFFALLVMVWGTGCKKNEAPTATSVDAALQQKVISWMDKQQTPQQTERMALNKAIQENLQWNRAWEGARGKDEQLLMIPLSKGLKLKNNSRLETHNYLLLFINEQGDVFAGQIFQSIGNSLFTKKTIPSYYNVSGSKEGLNGTYCTMNIHDIYYSQSVYENNRLKENSMHQIRQKATAAESNENCVDWYNVTTYYNTETGEILYQTETYIGTTCSGCVPYTGTPQTTITGQTEWDCNAGVGGSGEDGDETAIKEKMWVVMDAPDGGGSVLSVETMKGKRVSSEPQGGHFKWISSVAHTGCNFCSSQNGNSWSLREKQTGFNNPQEVFSRIKGRLFYGTSVYYPDKTEIFQFNQVFP